MYPTDIYYSRCILFDCFSYTIENNIIFGICLSHFQTLKKALLDRLQ